MSRPDFSKLTDQELVNVLHDSPIATPVSAQVGPAIGGMLSRLSSKVTLLNGAIDKVNESSALLVGETNRLTKRILHLTVVGVVLALVGVGVAFVQLFKR